MVVMVVGLGGLAVAINHMQKNEVVDDGVSTADLARGKTASSNDPNEDVSTDSGVGVPRYEDTPTRRPTPRPTRTATRRSGGTVMELAKSSNVEDRLIAVKRWRSRNMDERAGSRREMLEALNKRVNREIGLELLASFRENPVGVEEALDCLEFANTGIRRLLIKQLGDRQVTPDEVKLIQEILSEQKDTNDLLIEETLIRLGKPTKGCAARLIKARGIEWVKLGEGKVVLASLPLSELKPLAKNPDRDIRLLVCTLLSASKKPDEAVTLAVSLIKDDDADVKQRSVEALGNLGAPLAGWYLALAMTREKDRRSLELMRNAIGRLPYKTTVKRYISKLKRSKSTRYRHAAVLGYQSIARPLVVKPLVSLLEDKERTVRLASLKALQSLQRNKNTREEVKRNGVLVFRRLARDRSDPAMRRIARDLCLKIDGRIPR